MDIQDPHDLASLLAVIKDAGNPKRVRLAPDCIEVEFFDERPEDDVIYAPAPAHTVKNQDTAAHPTEPVRPGYSALFGGEVPKFKPQG